MAKLDSRGFVDDGSADLSVNGTLTAFGSLVMGGSSFGSTATAAAGVTSTSTGSIVAYSLTPQRSCLFDLALTFVAVKSDASAGYSCDFRARYLVAADGTLTLLDSSPSAQNVPSTIPTGAAATISNTTGSAGTISINWQPPSAGGTYLTAVFPAPMVRSTT